MANKNVYEVFDEFKKEKTKAKRIQVLRDNDCYALRQVLLGAFSPHIQFTIDTIPEYKKIDVPPGMSYEHMTGALSRVYLFVKDNDRVPPNLTEKRKQELLIQILESLEPPEAEVYCNMLMKDLKVPYLTPVLIDETFEGLLPKP